MLRTSRFSAGEIAGLFQVVTAVAAKVNKASMMNKVKTMIKVPHMLHQQLLWHYGTIGCHQPTQP